MQACIQTKVFGLTTDEKLKGLQASIIDQSIWFDLLALVWFDRILNHSLRANGKYDVSLVDATVWYHFIVRLVVSWFLISQHTKLTLQ